jgi:hypothetical protein
VVVYGANADIVPRLIQGLPATRGNIDGLSRAWNF